MQTPIVFVNFKTYERGTGQQAVELAKQCADFGAWVVVQPTDIRLVSEQTEAQVWAQHVDTAAYGKFTGSVTAEAVKQAGAVGTILNHSEKRLDPSVIEKTVQRCKEVGLKTCVCAESVDEAVSFKAFSPDYIAVELPELIGGDLSITTAEPGIVKDAVERVGSNVLMGAGVNSAEDLKIAAEYGCAGVLLASAIAQKAEDPREALKELYSAFM